MATRAEACSSRRVQLRRCDQQHVWLSEGRAACSLASRCAKVDCAGVTCQAGPARNLVIGDEQTERRGRECFLISIILHNINYQQSGCSSFIEMSCSSHLEMSCFGLGMLAGSLRDYGAGHACSCTGDIEHARTRPFEDHRGGRPASPDDRTVG